MTGGTATKRDKGQAEGGKGIDKYVQIQRYFVHEASPPGGTRGENQERKQSSLEQEDQVKVGSWSK